MSEFNKLLESVKVGKKLKESIDYDSEESIEKFDKLMDLLAQSVIGSEVVRIDSVEELGVFNDDYEMIDDFIGSSKMLPIDISKYLNKKDSEFFKGFIDHWEMELYLREVDSIKVVNLGNPAEGEYYISKSDLDKIKSQPSSNKSDQIGSDNKRSDFVIENGILIEYNGKKPNVVIPNNVKGIDDWVFSRCTSIKSVVIPNSVTSIGRSAFENCTSLTSIELPSSITSTGNYVFDNCTSLKSIVIPSSVTNIGVGVFENCTSLKSIEIPNSVKSIDPVAFRGCKSLTSIEIPSSVTSIGTGVFRDCDSLTSIIYKGTKKEALTNLKVKDKIWREYSSITKIICTDGDIELDSKD